MIGIETNHGDMFSLTHPFKAHQFKRFDDFGLGSVNGKF
jgi:hypothetical protein